MEETGKKKQTLTWKRALLGISLTVVAVPVFYGFFFFACMFVYAGTGNLALAYFIGLLPTLVVVTVTILSLRREQNKKKGE